MKHAVVKFTKAPGVGSGRFPSGTYQIVKNHLLKNYMLEMQSPSNTWNPCMSVGGSDSIEGMRQRAGRILGIDLSYETMPNLRKIYTAKEAQ
jgi:hypothetical protein